MKAREEVESSMLAILTNYMAINFVIFDPFIKYRVFGKMNDIFTVIKQEGWSWMRNMNHASASATVGFHT